jgi:hypothetical protein
LTDTEATPAIEAEAPKVEAAPAYDRGNLDDVLKRFRSIVTEIKDVSSDLAAHHRKHSRVHHINGYGQPLEAPSAHDPGMAARLHSLQTAIGEFVHNAGAQL